MLLRDMPLRRQDYWIVAVASMEQLIGGALSTVISVMLPMMQLMMHPELPPFLQGLIGAMGLIGIGLGSPIIGSLSDKCGYLMSFRLCPVIIMAGALICYFLPSWPWLIAGLLICGIGVGGGYSLDSAYISELLPDKWRLMMVGVAKSTCSIGFAGAAGVCLLILKSDPVASAWPRMAWVIFALGLITLLMRIRWWESPKWLMVRGQDAKAQQSAQNFLGKDVTIDTALKSTDPKAGKFDLRANIKQVIFSGVPWACEGLAVYGFSVFLPVLLMALGLEHGGETGIHKIVGSIETTTLVTFFMIPGFIIGLLMVQKVNNVKMMNSGFFFSVIGLLLLLAAYMLKWPSWAMILGFLIYELAINAGPHLITFIIPSRIYPVSTRAEGSGIAAFMGKVGAVGGVVLMPILLHAGGVVLVLSVSAAVMLLGSLIGASYGKQLGLLK